MILSLWLMKHVSHVGVANHTKWEHLNVFSGADGLLEPIWRQEKRMWLNCLRTGPVAIFIFSVFKLWILTQKRLFWLIFGRLIWHIYTSLVTYLLLWVFFKIVITYANHVTNDRTFPEGANICFHLCMVSWGVRKRQGEAVIQSHQAYQLLSPVRKSDVQKVNICICSSNK